MAHILLYSYDMQIAERKKTRNTASREQATKKEKKIRRNRNGSATKLPHFPLRL